MARHHCFIVAASITDEPGAMEQLRSHLAGLGDDSFAACPMVHFASFVILEKETTGRPPMLVMECNIDGSRAKFFDALLTNETLQIDEIYKHCVGYPQRADSRAKLRYFADHARRPQLFHIGAPWRSVPTIKEDRALRRRIEERLERTVDGSLMADLAVAPAGHYEYWTWEQLQPWAAWLLGLGGPALAWWLYSRSASNGLPRWVMLAIAAFYIALGAKAAVGGFALWRDALPALRDRVRPWIWSAVAVAAWSAIARWLWPSHPRWTLALTAALAIVLINNVYAAIRRASNERLASIRVNADGKAIPGIWEALTREPVDYRSETEWAQRLASWMLWPITYAVIAVPMWLLRGHMWLLIAYISGLVFLKSVWLAVLAGWPAKSNRENQDFNRIIVFIALAPIVAAVGGLLVMLVDLPPWGSLSPMPWLLAGLLLAGLFALWSLPLPSPEVERARRRGQDLEAVAGLEDRGVQNHMSAVVVLKEDHGFRVPALKAFLWLLNNLFYRCWAPDLYRGKLFGVPTVHFAQWVLLDKRNYLFFSNYDNSWTTYLNDFGEVLAAGLQKVWGQGKGNPGIKDVGLFKEYARKTMIPHAHWYRAYPGLTVRQVWNNREIRRGLAQATGEEAMVRTVKRAGAAPRVLPDFSHGRVR